jgi:hypothetical protein
MKAKNLLQIIPTLMISAAMATTSLAAGKVNPEAVSKGMLTALNKQVGLSADQQDKAKPIIDKHVADLEAVKKRYHVGQGREEGEGRCAETAIRHRYQRHPNSGPTEKMGGI